MKPYHFVHGPRADVFIFCDHASNHVPDWVEGPRLPNEDMQRHIAWDIGSEAVGRGLAAQLDCSALICGFSRLVADANRHVEAPGLIPIDSDATPIPFNHGLTRAQRKARLDRLYHPYHDALGAALDERPNTLAISVHSFTPQLRDQPRRQTDIGLLVRHDEETAARFVDIMSQIEPDFRVDINEPYSAYELNHTVDHHIASRGLSHLALELRQDHIHTDDGAARMTARLSRAMTALMER